MHATGNVLTEATLPYEFIGTNNFNGDVLAQRRQPHGKNDYSLETWSVVVNGVRFTFRYLVTYQLDPRTG